MKRNIYCFCYLPFIFLILSGSILFCQPSKSNFKFVRYSTSMGLSSNGQKCITQDNEGFIWIGTDDGLNRFDGHTFKVYRRDHSNPRSLRSNIITCLFTDKLGEIWVGTYAGGLSKYNKEKDYFDNYIKPINDTVTLENSDINSIVEDSFNNLWIGTSQGLYKLNRNTNKFTPFLTSGEQITNTRIIAHPHVRRMLVDGELIWITYGTGVISSLNTRTMQFKHFHLFEISSVQTADFSVNSLMPDKGNIWISTWSKGIWIFDKKTGKSRAYEKEPRPYINFIFKDNKNQVWYSPESGGLVLNTGKNEINFKFDDYDKYSISSNSLSDIFQDRQGNLWVASKQGDLNYLILDNPFNIWYKNPSSVQGLTNNLVTAVMEDNKKQIWVGYQDGGIDIIDPVNKKPRRHITGDASSGLGAGAVLFIYQNRNGTVWIGKYLDGLKKFDSNGNHIASYQHIEGNGESIAGNDVRNISEDSKGNFWLAIHGGGVDKFDPVTGRFTHHKRDIRNPSTSIREDWTFSAICDKNDNVWVGTIDGVSKISAGSTSIKHYVSNSKEGYNLSNDISRVIYIDSKGFIWVGTNEGLNKIDEKSGRIKKYYANDGLPSNVITAIYEDHHYNLWISTSKGLCKFSPAKETFKNYSIEDGLVTEEFNTFASFKTKSGEMFFGGREGLNCFHPDSIKTNMFRPPVYITDFKLFNQSVPVKDENSDIFGIPEQINYCKTITLDYSQNVITFEFVALNYLNLSKNQYRYKLEGFEKDWTLPGYKREVTYTNLHPGEYTFKVIASNNDGIWNHQGTSLRIIVNPPFWRTNWAYLFYFIVVLILLYYFRKLILHEAEIKRTVELEKHEIQKLQEMDALKMQFFSNVSHEFRTPLTLIVGPIESLLNSTKDQLQKIQLKLIQRNVSRLLRLINQLMDFRKIEESSLELNLAKNDVVGFIKEITGAFDQEAAQKKIALSFNTAFSSYDIWFDADKLDKIIYNLLSNAFKYTPDFGCISVSLEFIEGNGTGSTYKIIVKDTGIGIPLEELNKIFDRFYQVKNSLTTHGTGIGLSFVYELVKLHQGNISVKSEPDKGSEFTVVLPMWTEENKLPFLSSVADKNKTEIKIRENYEIEAEEYQEEESQKDNFPRLLIIEDNPDMRLFIKNEFKNNYIVSEAHDGSAGLKKAFEEIPDVILCDVMMPGMDGYQVCKSLKHDERTSHIPLIMLTARTSEQHTIEGFESGADDYVGKPLSPAVLKARIKNLIESRALLRKKFIKEPFATIKEISPSKIDGKLLNKAYSIVEKHLNDPDFDASQFAHEIGMSRTQLYRKISAVSGQSVNEFIRIIRLKKAADLLVKGDKNISEVAFEVGFNSLSYFTTSFSEYFGITPSKYIEKNRALI